MRLSKVWRQSSANSKAERNDRPTKNSNIMNGTVKVTQRVLRFGRAALLSFGPSGLKRIIWDQEYSGNKWDFADHTETDCVYPHLEKYAANGSILDLGCGTGNTANELAANTYEKYLGVDISEVCLNKARKRSEENGRAAKNQFVSGDLLQFTTSEKFDVILLRESLYHVPISKIEPTLNRYAKNLKDSGVFIVRIYTSEINRQSPNYGKPKPRPTAMIRVVESKFDVIENCHYQESGSTVVVFRPKR
jgi:2-polyprenyl-3-methyl-5-hydroxy-6-metoxy-1,4-benzoquinol methylase